MKKGFLFILIIILLFIPVSPTNGVSFRVCDYYRNKIIKTLHKYQIVPLNISVCEENLLLFNSIIKQFNIFYWLSEGTALGVIRENRILPWDDDIDVSFNYEYRDIFINKVLPILLKNGFVVAELVNNKNFFSLIRKNEKVDVDIVQINGKCTANRTKNTNYDTRCNNLIPYLKNIKPITFLNTEFYVPGEDYLEYLYGKDWKTPKTSK